MSYSIILPTLNEAGHIVKLIENIIDVFSKIQEKFEIIIVDDNSTDGTLDIVGNIAKDYKNIHFFLRKELKIFKKRIKKEFGKFNRTLL